MNNIVPMKNLRGSLCKPRNEKQVQYVKLLDKMKPCIVVGYGTAGSGKTKLAVEMGLDKLYKNQVQKLIITRPAVAVDEEQHGFLPGDLNQKMMPWIMPIYDALSSHLDVNQIDKLIKSQVLEIAPLAYMRGRTFEKSWIVCDEAQNMTCSQMLMMLTRIGKDSKLVFTGDPMQHDRQYPDQSGLVNFLQLIEDSGLASPDVEILQFEDSDVERHPVIPYILKLYTKN